jgi:hypothetical protein
MTPVTQTTSGPNTSTNQKSLPAAGITSPAASTSTLQDTPTPEQLLATRRDLVERRKITDTYIADIDAQLTDMHAAGVIGDTFEHHGARLTWTERKGNWSYSPAVANLKTLEEAEGIADRKPSSFFWTMRITPAA